ncbi:uncharacterized protein RCC_09911 [Ramularia collo-cygni]|uniref:Uncharacterized protein n=1 Tax=Ramularia collo-cygni TaxID=112498 RepID=A0A2D3VMY5_9PEZI|nr:uncharacterized protein RCC_09911 [Ramularia collo-cygni]CZT24194.1 uncharacterized protein RCC_09911 [Ramularia collo-cygni]
MFQYQHHLASQPSPQDLDDLDERRQSTTSSALQQDSERNSLTTKEGAQMQTFSNSGGQTPYQHHHRQGIDSNPLPTDRQRTANLINPTAEMMRGLVLFGKWHYIVEWSKDLTSFSAAHLWFYSTGGLFVWQLLPMERKAKLWTTWNEQAMDLRNECGARLALSSLLQHFASLHDTPQQDLKAVRNPRQSVTDQEAEEIVNVFEILLWKARNGDHEVRPSLSLEGTGMIHKLCKRAGTPSHYIVELFCIMRLCGMPFRLRAPSPWSAMLAGLDFHLVQGGYIAQDFATSLQDQYFAGEQLHPDLGSQNSSPKSLHHQQIIRPAGNASQGGDAGAYQSQAIAALVQTQSFHSGLNQPVLPPVPLATSGLAPVAAHPPVTQANRLPGCSFNTHLFPNLQAGLASYYTRNIKVFNIPPNDDDVNTVKLDCQRHVNELYNAMVEDPICTTAAQTSGVDVYKKYIADKLKDGLADERHQRLAWRMWQAIIELHETGMHNLEFDEIQVHTNGTRKKQLWAQDAALTLLARLQAVKDTLRQYKLLVKDCGLNERCILFVAFQPFMERALKEQSKATNKNR